MKLFILLKFGPLYWTASPFDFNFKTKRYLLNTSYELGFVFAFVLNDYHCPDQPIIPEFGNSFGVWWDLVVLVKPHDGSTTHGYVIIL
jgi:hypothetical protein